MSLETKLFKDEYPSSYRETDARANFNEARDYAISLLKTHEFLTGGGAGRPDSEYEALKKSALILAVTAWESFVEDTVKEQLEILLNGVADPALSPRVKIIFYAAAEEWILSAKDQKDNNPKPLSLLKDFKDWVGDGWKVKILKSLEKHLVTFHTPNTENTTKLFKRYLGLEDFSVSWHWQRVNSTQAKSKLDKLIQMRGEAVHEGKRRTPQAGSTPTETRKTTVINALNLIYCLVVATEKALGIAPSALPPPPPGG